MNKFNWINYLYLNQDLISNGIQTEKDAIAHYRNYGRAEGRLYEFVIPDDFDIDFYQNFYPFLKDKPRELTYAHYTIYGTKNESIYKSQHISHDSNDNIEKFFIDDNKTIFYFAPHLPEFDTSSGGYRLLQILKILSVDLGYNVYFFANKSVKSEHEDKLKEYKIKYFLASPDESIYTIDIVKKLLDLGVKPNFVFISWLDMVKQMFYPIKNILPDAKIIIDTVDIHWLRQKRYLEQQNIDPDDNFDFNQSIEQKFYEAADAVLCVTEQDKLAIRNFDISRHINTKIVSNIYPNNNIEKHMTEAKDILFVGGFDHEPNIDAAISASEIYKEFIKTYNGNYKPKLLIVGANPPQEIKELDNNKDIFVLGFQKDLDIFYTKSLVSLSPLKWGAGIKGKICESIYKRTCVLTSDIGNEGIDLINGKDAFIANSTSEYVQALSKIYSMDTKSIQAIQDNALQKIDKLTSIKSAKNILQSMVEPKEIVISIVSYNHSNLLEKCIKSIINNTLYPNYKIVVVDNASKDNTWDIIRKYMDMYPDLCFGIKNKKNEFFIKPNNNIIQKYSNSDIVLVNDDIEILTNCWLSRLYSAAYSADYIACAGGKTIYPNGKIAEAGAELYRDGSGRNKGRYENANLIQYNQQMYTGYVSGCLMYMRRDAINKIGILDSDLEPMYYEDSEWQYRAHINGLKTIYEPLCVAIHREGSSSGNDINVGPKRYQEINRKKFITKYAEFDIEQYN